MRTKVNQSRCASLTAIARKRVVPMLTLVLAAAVGIGTTLVAPPASAARAGSALLAKTSVVLSVKPATAPLSASTSSSPLASLTLSVDGGGDVDGDVELLVDGKVFVTRPARATMLVKLPTTALGVHTVSAHYLGSATRDESESEPTTYTVLKADTSIFVSGDGEEVSFSSHLGVAVGAVGSVLTPDEPVKVTEDGVDLGEVALEEGTGDFELADLALGQHTLHFAYPGDDGQTNPSEATVTVTVIEGQAAFEPEIKFDRTTAVIGSDPIAATVSIRQYEGPAATPEGDMSIYFDGALLATHPGSEFPVTLDLPVDELDRHELVTTLADTDTQVGASVGAHYDVVKATTAFEVDDTHPYERADDLRIAVTSDGPVPPPGDVYLIGGRSTPEGYERFELVDGKVDYPLDGLPLGPLRLEMYYDGDERNEGIIDVVVVMLVRSAGDTTVLTDVDRDDPIIDGAPAIVTASVVVEGGAAPEGVLEFTLVGDDEPFAVRDAAVGLATVEVPVDRVAQGPVVTFVPSTSSQRPSRALVNYRVRAGKTEPRVTVPTGPVRPGHRLPFAIAVLDATVTAAGLVLVTDGEPSNCRWKDPVEHPYSPPSCENDLAVLSLDAGAGELTLPDLDAGHHELVFWYFPFRDRPKSLPTTQRSRTTVPVLVQNGPGTLVELDRMSAVVGGATVTATATVDSAPDPEGEFEFFIDGRSYDRRAAGAGTVSMDIPVDVVGRHTVTATYTGTKSGAGPTSRPVTYYVTKASTSVTVDAPSEPVTSNGALDVSVVAVDSSVLPTGWVVVAEGTRSIGTIDPVTGGWRFALTSLSAGAHNLTFRYAGDELTNGSSAVATVVIRKPDERLDPAIIATSTSASLDHDRITTEDKVRVTAVVKAADGSTVSGPVTFLVDGVSVATEAAIGGVAVTTLDHKAVGTHTVVARFLGSASLARSESTEHRFTVTPGVRAPSKIRAAIKKLRSGALRITASVSSDVVLTGHVRVVQEVKVTARTGKTRIKTRVIGGGVIRKPGTTATVVMRATRLMNGPSVISVRYLGSAKTLASRRDYRAHIHVPA